MTGAVRNASAAWPTTFIHWRNTAAEVKQEGIDTSINDLENVKEKRATGSRHCLWVSSKQEGNSWRVRTERCLAGCLGLLLVDSENIVAIECYDLEAQLLLRRLGVLHSGHVHCILGHSIAVYVSG